MVSDLAAMASNLVAMASTLVAMASNLVAMGGQVGSHTSRDDDAGSFGPVSRPFGRILWTHMEVEHGHWENDVPLETGVGPCTSVKNV